MLLFLVVLFVYPLKFVSTLLFGPWMGLNPSIKRPDGSVVAPIEPGQEPSMMIMFGLTGAILLAASGVWSAARRRRYENSPRK